MDQGNGLLQNTLNFHIQYLYPIMRLQTTYKMGLLLHGGWHLHSRKSSLSLARSSPNIGRGHTNMESESRRSLKIQRKDMTQMVILFGWTQLGNKWEKTEWHLRLLS